MLKKLVLKPGTNQENTRYFNENGWWQTDKVRFRQGTPEKIGGWSRISGNTFKGVARSMFDWATLAGTLYLGVGTNLKYYVEYSGAYYDITPVRLTAVLTGPFTTTASSTTVVVTHAAHGAITKDFVSFSGASAVGGLTLSGEYQITYISANSYSVQAASTASSSTTGGGTVTATYQINTGAEINTPTSGWGAGPWGGGAWGVGLAATLPLRMWSQGNFGEALVLAPMGGAMYYWAPSGGLAAPAVTVASLVGADSVPLLVDSLMVSDVSRFVLAFGTNEYLSTVHDSMVVRWADQESVVDWKPATTNQAGSIRLSHGTSIVAQLQVRQEVLVWTNTALYSMQYVGAPIVWGATLVGSGMSIIGPRAATVASGVTYWMGNNKFYKYDGRVQTLRCDLRASVFGDFNTAQGTQVFAGSNEAFNEVWWFYPSASSSVPNLYVVYNYEEDVWYSGTMTRYAWLDSGLNTYPRATIADKVLYHEYGTDDNSTAVPAAIPAYIESCEFDIDDGDHFAFVWRILPDFTFRGSTIQSPSVLISLYPMTNAGSGYGASVGGSDTADTVRTVTVPVEQFTGQVYVRIRGRQMALRVESTDLGVDWQMGGIRIDLKQDGRR